MKLLLILSELNLINWRKNINRSIYIYKGKGLCDESCYHGSRVIRPSLRHYLSAWENMDIMINI